MLGEPRATAWSWSYAPRSSRGSVLGDDSSSGAAARYVDSSTERLQVSVRNYEPARHLLACNGLPVPLVAAGTPGYYVAGVRYKAWKPWSSLHPTLDLDTPLRFDLIDRASQLSLGGATYHVVHPGGRSYDTPPVNAKEAEARRARRFEAGGHTTGVIDVPALDSQLAWRGAVGVRLRPHLGSASTSTAPLGPLVTVKSPGERSRR